MLIVIAACLLALTAAYLPALLYPDADFQIAGRLDPCSPEFQQPLTPIIDSAKQMCDPLANQSIQASLRATQVNAQSSVRQLIGILFGALLAGGSASIGVWVTHRNHKEDLLQQQLVHAEEVATNRGKADDDRFATAIDQLGHAAAAVRVGALHSLYRLASTSEQRQITVVDVFCSYLRQPFNHPARDPSPNAAIREIPSHGWAADDPAERRERNLEHEVRQTATRQLSQLLRQCASESNYISSQIAVDLTSAQLDGLDLSDLHLGKVILKKTFFAGPVNLLGLGAMILMTDGMQVDGRVTAGESEIESAPVDLTFGADCVITDWLMVTSKAGLGKINLGARSRVEAVNIKSTGGVAGIVIERDAQIGQLVIEGCVIGETRLGEGSKITKLGVRGELQGGINIAADCDLEYLNISQSKIHSGISLPSRSNVAGKIHIHDSWLGGSLSAYGHYSIADLTLKQSTITGDIHLRFAGNIGFPYDGTIDCLWSHIRGSLYVSGSAGYVVGNIHGDSIVGEDLSFATSPATKLTWRMSGSSRIQGSVHVKQETRFYELSILDDAHIAGDAYFSESDAENYQHLASIQQLGKLRGQIRCLPHEMSIEFDEVEPEWSEMLFYAYLEEPQIIDPTASGKASPGSPWLFWEVEPPEETA